MEWLIPGRGSRVAGAVIRGALAVLAPLAVADREGEDPHHHHQHGDAAIGQRVAALRSPTPVLTVRAAGCLLLGV